MSASAAVVTGTFDIKSATLADLYSATFDGALIPCTTPTPPDAQECAFFNGYLPTGRNIVVTPTGTGSGSLNVNYDSHTGEILQINSLYITLPKLTLVIQGTTTVFMDPTPPNNNFPSSTAPNFDIPFIEGGTGTLGRDLDGTAHPQSFLGQGTPDPDQGIAVGQASIFQHDDSSNYDAPDFAVLSDVVDNCTGPYCALIGAGLLTVDGVRYRLEGTVNGSGGGSLVLKAQTGNGSIYRVTFNTCPVNPPPGACLLSRVFSQAYYDPALDITWPANANLADTNTFGVTGINPDGAMTWFKANEWIAAMNAAAYLGRNNWRLPHTLQPDPTCVLNTEIGYYTGCTGSEMGHLFYIDGVTFFNPGPFVIVQGADYWSGRQGPGCGFYFGFFYGDQQCYPDSFNFYVWPVSPGDAGNPAPDATPDPFSFIDLIDVAISAQITSNTVTITGINVPAPISVTGGEYSIGCTGNFTTLPGTISNGQTVCVRHISVWATSATTNTMLTVGGVTDTFTSTTASVADTEADPFELISQNNVPRNAIVTSNTVTITGINTPVQISAMNGYYRFGCTGDLLSNPGVIRNGETVCVVQQSADTFSTSKDTTLMLHAGPMAVVGTFTTTTMANNGADPFTFINQTNVQLAATITSNTVTITGITVPVPIAVTGGEYSIGCSAAFRSDVGTITNGQSVCVRHVNAGATSTLLDIGGVTAVFTSTTASSAIDTTPDGFSFEPTFADISVLMQSNPVTILGISAPTRISVSGGVYSIGCFDDGPWDYTATPGLISNGQTVCVQHMSAGMRSTLSVTYLNVGGVGSSFESQTGSLINTPIDYTPDLFSFPDQPNVPLSSLRTSDPVTIRGTQVAVNISVTDGAYSIGCTGNFTSGAGTISSGQNVCVRHTSASTLDTATHTVLTVSNVSDRFTSTTTSAIPPPDDDGDGVANTLDNCTLKANPTQCDSDGDGYGNHCDGDLNNNGFTNAFDTPLYRAQLGQPSVGPTYNQADINCNGFVNAFDTPLFRSLLGRPLGPSGLHP